MSAGRLSFTSVVAVASREAVTHFSCWLPALVLLAPTLVLQLGAPTYLRTRLAPAPSTVVAGAILLVWLAQIATPAVCALVHARRAGERRNVDRALVRMSLAIGTRVTVGLAALVLPGLWLQARYAFAPLQTASRLRGTLARSGTNERDAPQISLFLMGGTLLLLSALGQSAIAAIAEALNTITAAGHVNGRTVFELNFFPHALTSLVAYFWSVATLTLYALCVSTLFDEARGVARREASPGRARRASAWVRVAQATGAAVALGALTAAIYKIQQHVN